MLLTLTHCTQRIMMLMQRRADADGADADVGGTRLREAAAGPFDVLRFLAWLEMTSTLGGASMGGGARAAPGALQMEGPGRTCSAGGD